MLKKFPKCKRSVCFYCILFVQRIQIYRSKQLIFKKTYEDCTFYFFRRFLRFEIAKLIFRINTLHSDKKIYEMFGGELRDKI